MFGELIQEPIAHEFKTVIPAVDFEIQGHSTIKVYIVSLPIGVTMMIDIRIQLIGNPDRSKWRHVNCTISFFAAHLQ